MALRTRTISAIVEPENDPIQVLLDCSNSSRMQMALTPGRRQQRAVEGWVVGNKTTKHRQRPTVPSLKTVYNWKSHKQETVKHTRNRALLLTTSLPEQ